MQTRFSNCGSDRQPVQCFCFPESSTNITHSFHTSGQAQQQTHSARFLQRPGAFNNIINATRRWFLYLVHIHHERLPVSLLVPRRCDIDGFFVFGTILKITFH